MGTVAFDGIVLSDLYTVIPRRGVSSREVASESVPGRDGVVVTGMDYVPPTLSLVFVLGPTSDIPGAVRELQTLLDAREPKKLELGEDNGLYCMAMPQGESSWRRLPFSSAIEVPFLVADAAMYGAERKATLPSGGSVTFTVGGTYPTRPRLVASSAYRDSTSGQWGVRLDSVDVLKLAFGSSSSRSIDVDCHARTATVSGDVAIPTLDSDWLEFEPGTHTLEMHLGTGATTVTWRERWLA